MQGVNDQARHHDSTRPSLILFECSSSSNNSSQSSPCSWAAHRAPGLLVVEELQVQADPNLPRGNLVQQQPPRRCPLVLQLLLDGRHGNLGATQEVYVPVGGARRNVWRDGGEEEEPLSQGLINKIYNKI